VEIFTKTDMAKQHNLVQDLVSEVTFTKVESMLKLEVHKYNRLSQYCKHPGIIVGY